MSPKVCAVLSQRLLMLVFGLFPPPLIRAFRKDSDSSADVASRQCLSRVARHRPPSRFRVYTKGHKSVSYERFRFYTILLLYTRYLKIPKVRKPFSRRALCNGRGAGSDHVNGWHPPDDVAEARPSGASGPSRTHRSSALGFRHQRSSRFVGTP